jgi:hypothetical protein
MTAKDPPTDGDAPVVALEKVLPPVKRIVTPEVDIDAANDEALLLKLAILHEEHADLDAAIRAIEAQMHHDRLQVARLKKKKLALKDRIQTIKDQLTPDIIA